MELITVYFLLVIFVATLVRSTFGFGESLIAVPLLVLFLPIETAVPLSVLISIVIAAVIVLQDHRKIHFQSAKWLIFFAALGIPFGLYLLIRGNEVWVKSILGFLLIVYSLYSLFAKKTFHLPKDKKTWLFLCGFLSGVFGGAYGLNGPPLVVYGNLRKWSPQHFRATLQAYFLPISMLGMFGYWQQDLWTPEVDHYFLLAIPVILPTIFLGRYLNHRLPEKRFLKYIYLGLICIGLLLLAKIVMS